MSLLLTRIGFPLLLLLIVLTLGIGPAYTPADAGSGATPSPRNSSCGTLPSFGKEKIVKAEDLIIQLRKEGGVIDCSNYIIEGPLNLYKIPTKTDPKTQKLRIEINRKITFHGATFKNPVRSWEQSKALATQPQVIFLKPISFINAAFKDHVNLDNVTFEQKVDFGDAHFIKMASFTKAIFKKEAGFRSTQFDERALFKNATFEYKVDFTLAKFNLIAFFYGTKFKHQLAPNSNHSCKSANFLYTRFMGETLFSKASFDCTARFIGTSFHGPTYFSKTTFHDNAYFAGGAHFDNDVTFTDARFTKKDLNKSDDGKERFPPVLFGGVSFSGNTIFSKAEFNYVGFYYGGSSEANIGVDTVFKKRADFRKTIFNKDVDLQRVVFSSEADFSGAKLNGNLDITGIDIHNASLRLSWNQIRKKPGDELKLVWRDVYSEKALKDSMKQDEEKGSNASEPHDDFIDFLYLLERNYKQLGQLSDAGNVHYFMEEQKAKTHSYNKTNPINNISAFFRTVCYKGIYGYGVRPLNQIWTALLFIIGFAFIYMGRNVVRQNPSEESKLRLRITDIPVGQVDGQEPSHEDGTPTGVRGFFHRYLKGLSFSFFVFTKIGYKNMYVGNRFKYVVLLEWFIGAAVMVSFFINLSNTLPILHKLVSTIF